MKKGIVYHESRIFLVGGGQIDHSSLARALSQNGAIVAADGGAGAVLAAGHVPDAVIGDMDSLSDETRARLPAGRLHHVAAQDDTDFDKCLDRIAAPLILGYGFLGARLDHQLAAMSTLVRFAHQRCVLLGGGDVVLALPPTLEMDLPAGCRVSLFPMRPVAGKSSGLDWSIDGLAFAPWDRIGTSNSASGGTVRIEMAAPGMLLILPEAAMGSLEVALSARPDCWPAP